MRRGDSLADRVGGPQGLHVDGALLVTPAPGSAHQVCVVRLLTLLETHRPPDQLVLTAPYDYVVQTTTVLQPDLLVARREDVGEANPDPDEPSVVVFTLEEGGYRETARAVGDEALEIAEPFPLTLVPSRLTERIRP